LATLHEAVRRWLAARRSFIFEGRHSVLGVALYIKVKLNF
jgi:hypothetical protein